MTHTEEEHADSRKGDGGCMLVGAVLALAACGSSKKSSSSSGAASSTTGSSGGNTIDIYSSLPAAGRLDAQTDPAGQRHQARALAGRQQGRAASPSTTQSLDDSTASARQVGPDPDGGQRPQGGRPTRRPSLHRRVQLGRSEVSIPILNQAGIPQISPANTYVGLTTNEPGSAPGEPQKYYPTG